jgi:SAM-dependent methyltransferase
MASANVELVRSIFSAWERGDWSSAEWADPDIEFVRVDGPAPGSWRGFAEVAGGVREMLSAWDDFHLAADEYREFDGGRVLALTSAMGRGKRSGVQLRTPGANLFQIGEGRVTRVVTYYERDRALADLGVAEGSTTSRLQPAAASQLQFDQSMVEGLERLYATRDVLRRRDLVRAALAAQPGDRVLDVGCGPGFYVAELLETVGREGSLVGLDVSRDMLAAAAQRTEGQPNVEFYEAGATVLPAPDESFDRALSVQVLEYVEDIPAALAEMHRVLRPGGRLVVWDVDWSTISWHAIDRDLMERALEAFDRHLAHRSLPRTLAAQLRAAGFEDVEMEGHVFATNEPSRETYGGSLVSMLKTYVVGQGGMSRREATAWRDEQRALAAEGKFFFSVTQFCFAATRPA